MVIFPLLAVACGLAVVVAYCARKGVTIDNRQGTQGSLIMAVVVFIIIGIIGYVLDYYTDWSTLVTFLWVRGGTLQMLAVLIYTGLATFFICMLYSANKCGHVVA